LLVVIILRRWFKRMASCVRSLMYTRWPNPWRVEELSYCKSKNPSTLFSFVLWEIVILGCVCLFRCSCSRSVSGLLDWMMTENPEHRPTAQQCLDWFCPEYSLPWLFGSDAVWRDSRTFLLISPSSAICWLMTVWFSPSSLHRGAELLHKLDSTICILICTPFRTTASFNSLELPLNHGRDR
jgi:hypothetical protein